MIEQSSGQDAFVKNLGKKFERAAIADKEVLTERIVERVGDIVKALERNQAEFSKASHFSEKMAITTEMFELQNDLQKLRTVYDKLLKPSREELLSGDEALDPDEIKLIERETPFLLIGGQKPIPLVTKKESKMETAETAIIKTKPELEHTTLAPVMLERSRESGARETTPPRITPPGSEEHALLESINREAKSLAPKQRLAFFRAQRDKILDNLTNAYEDKSLTEEEREQLVGRLETRFHLMQERLAKEKRIGTDVTKKVHIDSLAK